MILYPDGSEIPGSEGKAFALVTQFASTGKQPWECFGFSKSEQTAGRRFGRFKRSDQAYLWKNTRVVRAAK